ncbi:MAG TPA: GNAT family N-acetyltransferase, partial [Anaerolineae bacterium]|nr:GNAT family N-acetyltransferase [Anaerolineae bacterium]
DGTSGAIRTPVAEVLDLVERCADADGVRPISEHAWLHIRHGGDAGSRHLVATVDGALVGYAHLDVTDVVDGPSVELAVDPAHRRIGIGQALLEAAIGAAPGGRLRMWAHGESTGADSLAIACGSVHAMQSQAAELDIDLIKAIHEQIPNTPLVLHGSSGVKTDSFMDAIDHGISKINVATYLNQAFTRGLRETLARYPDEVDPRKFLTQSREYVKEAVREKIRLFRSANTIDASGGFKSPSKQYRSADIGAAE